MSLVDSHCHLDFSQFDEDRNDVIASCRAQGINLITLPGVNPAQWRDLSNLAQQYSILRFAVGIHPWWIEKTFDREEPIKAIQKRLESESQPFLSDSRCIAIGETGLDATIDTPMELQIGYLTAHIHLANQWQKPIILHCVKAHNELLSVLRANPVKCGGVVHAFSGSEALALQYIDKGMRLGVGGTITYSRANKTRKAIAALPLEHLLLETDAPDMPLAGHQGERNSPERLIDVAKTLAELKSLPLETIAKQTTDNYHALFTLSK